MEIVTRILQLLLSISILIVLHEFGHFMFARLFGTRVEKFYLFFNPWFSIFKIKRGDTEYGLGWVPLGGYVKISGMIDESMDREAMKKPPQPWEFRSKPAWQRLLIMLGGVIMNLIVGFVIYSFVLLNWGERYLPNKSLTDGVYVVDSIAYEMGFRTGDKVISVDGKEIDRFSDIMPELLFGREAHVQRGDSLVNIPIPIDFSGNLVERGSYLFFPRMPFYIHSVPDTSVNVNVGLQPNDKVTAVNGIPLKYYDEFAGLANGFKGQIVTLNVERDGQELVLDAQITEAAKLDVIIKILSFDDLMRYGIYEYETREYTFAEAFPAGLSMAYDKLAFYVKQFRLIFDFRTGAYKGLGGFGTISKLYPGKWIWEDFWSMTAFLSLILAVMNILPIPALDGGHVTFLLYEIITRRKPGDKFMEYAQIVGMIIILLLLVVANGNDIMRGCS